MKKKKLFFLGYGGGHINALIPVIKEFYYDSGYEIVVVGINLAVETLRQNHIACKSLSDYLDEEALTIGHPLALQRHNFNSTVSYADSIAYYGFSMRDLNHEVGKDIADKIYKVYDRRLFFPVKSMKKILQKESPDVVIVTTMYRFELAALQAAKELGIPSVKIEDLVGIISKPFPDKIIVSTEKEKKKLTDEGIEDNQVILKKELKEPSLVKYCNFVYHSYLNMRPTRECVISNYVKNTLIKNGHNPQNVFVTGQPAFDEFKKYDSIDINQYFELLNLDSKKPILSFMSQPLDNRQNILEYIIRGIREIPDLQFIIKLHPNEDGKLQRLILKEMNYQACIVKEIPSPIITKLSTIVSTVSSTTGLEAACLDKNLIYFQFFEQDEDILYEEMGIGIKITEPEEISPTIKKLMFNTEIISSLSFHRKEYTNYGNSANNVKKVIEQLLEDE